MNPRNVDSERSGEGSSGIPSQDSQDLSAAAAATALITEKSSDAQSVDVTNKGMVKTGKKKNHLAFSRIT